MVNLFNIVFPVLVVLDGILEARDVDRDDGVDVWQGAGHLSNLFEDDVVTCD